jgi:hypothetical protein
MVRPRRGVLHNISQGHKVYAMVKDVHIVLAKQKRTSKNIEEDDMWKESIF